MTMGDNSHLRLLNICRVSSNEQAEGYSLEVQNNTNREWAQRKGHVILDTIQYVETASKQKERKRFREIIDRICKDSSIDGAVFHKVDRACRNITDLALLEKIETEKNKKVFFSTQEFPQNAAGRLSVGVMGVVSRWYTDNLKEEVHKGFKGKIEAGEYPHTPPYGYCKDKKTKLVVHDPEKAEVIRTIFGLMATNNYSIETLREELYRRGLYFSQRVKRWTFSHLVTVLRHPFYIGKIRWRGKIYEGKHKPIITERRWKQVQAQLDGRKHCFNFTRRQFIYSHGLIQCAYCGKHITAEIHKHQYIYYRCSQYRMIEHPVKPAYVPEQEIESQIIAMLEKLILPKDVYDWALDYLRRLSIEDKNSSEEQVRKLKKRLSETQASLDGLLFKATEIKGTLAERFITLAEQKQNEVSVLQAQIEQLRTGKQTFSPQPMKIIELAQGLSKQYVTLKPPQKRQIVQSVLSNLMLDDVTLCGTYRLPFEILAKNAHRPLNCG